MTVTSSASTSAERRPGLSLLAAALTAILLAGCGAASLAAVREHATVHAGPGHPASLGTGTAVPAARGSSAGAPAVAAPRVAGPPYRVGERVFDFVDPSRTIKYRGHARQARPLVTVVRYPEGTHGPVPLIVFGHGFAVTPATYWRLLRSWAQAGYVVAAPVFPLENQHAPSGPNESDLVNQPRDMSFVITQMLALSAAHTGLLAGLIAPREIGVSGQSDGGETALAVAYDRYYLDPRIRAAAILSGAELPGAGPFYFPHPSPPLLASQGTADVVNLPHFTYQFFTAAPRPKYLLKLRGAPHLPPYTTEQPQLSIVGRVTTAFFDRYLKGQARGIGAMLATGNVSGVASLTAQR
jgi:dienelactone hydrolase